MGPAGRDSRYLPAEDTRLLIKSLRHASGGRCLEIGFGSGAAISTVAKRFELAAGTDIMGLSQAVIARSPRVDLLIADRATCFRDRSFDLVFFNPPYLPSQAVEDRAVDGGPTGIEVPAAFMEEGARVLRKGGRMLVLLSAEGDLKGFVTRARALGFTSRRVASKKLFYETLVVFSLKRGVNPKDPPSSIGK